MNASRVVQPFATSLWVAFFRQSVVHELPVYTGNLFVVLRRFSPMFSSRCSGHKCRGQNTEYRHCTASTEALTSSSLVASSESLLSTYMTAGSESSSKTWYSKLSGLMIRIVSFPKAACTPLRFFLAVCDHFPLRGMTNLSQQLGRDKGHAKRLTVRDDVCCLYSSLISAASYFNQCRSCQRYCTQQGPVSACVMNNKSYWPDWAHRDELQVSEGARHFDHIRSKRYLPHNASCNWLGPIILQ